MEVTTQKESIARTVQKEGVLATQKETIMAKEGKTITMWRGTTRSNRVCKQKWMTKIDKCKNKHNARRQKIDGAQMWIPTLSKSNNAMHRVWGSHIFQGLRLVL